MRKKVLVIDTSVLCTWLEVPGMDSCGPEDDRWTYARLDQHFKEAADSGATLVLPLAAIIETGNHISQLRKWRYQFAQKLTTLVKRAVQGDSPWAPFRNQAVLWENGPLKKLLDSWPKLCTQGLSLADVSIKDVGDYYRTLGFHVELLTGDQGLRAFQPTVQEQTPRRRQ